MVLVPCRSCRAHGPRRGHVIMEINVSATFTATQGTTFHCGPWRTLLQCHGFRGVKLQLKNESSCHIFIQPLLNSPVTANKIPFELFFLQCHNFSGFFVSLRKQKFAFFSESKLLWSNENVFVGYILYLLAMNTTTIVETSIYGLHLVECIFYSNS